MFKKLKKGILAGTIFSTAANMNACVYGPPPESVHSDVIKTDRVGTQEETSKAVDDTTTTTTAKETDFDPSENQNEDVYGPPEWFGGEPDEPEESDDTAQSEQRQEFDPSGNENACVYGPPEWFEDK